MSLKKEKSHPVRIMNFVPSSSNGFILDFEVHREKFVALETVLKLITANGV